MSYCLTPLHAQAPLAIVFAIGLGVAAVSRAQAQSAATADLSRARAVVIEAQRLIDAGQLQAGAAKAAESLTLYRALPDDNAMVLLGRGDANYLLGRVFLAQGKDDRVRDYWEAALTHYQQLTGRTASERLLAVTEAMLPVLDRLGLNAELLELLETVPPLQAELDRPSAEQGGARRNLAVLLMRAGRTREAAFQAEQAMSLAEQAKLPAAEMADYLDTLGIVENRIDRADVAAGHFRRALTLLEPLPKTAASRAEIMLDLANPLGRMGDSPAARRELDRAVQLVDKNPDAELIKAKLLLNIALDDYDWLGKQDAGVSGFRAALRIAAGKKGAEKIESVALLNIASHLVEIGRNGEAIGLYRDLVAKQDSASADMDDVNTARRNLGLTLAKIGRRDEALEMLLVALRTHWLSLSANLPAMTRQQKTLELNNEARFVNPIYAIAFTDSGVGGGNAYEATLLTKAIFSEASHAERVVADPPRSAEASVQQGRYVELRRELSRCTIERSDEKLNAEKTALAKEAQQIELELRRDPRVFRPDARLAVTRLADVRSRLRPGEILLEYVVYTTYEVSHWREGEPHYGVFVVDGRTGLAMAVDLGPRKSIDDLIADFRDRESTQADPLTGRLDEAELARAADVVRARILDPVLRGQPRPTRIYVAPDGLIGLVPFEALPTNRPPAASRYLIEDADVVYLLTGRDLVRRDTAAQASNDVWLVGDPAFDARPQQRASVSVALPPPGVPAASGSAAPVPAAASSKRLVAGANAQTGDAQSEVPSDWMRLDATRNIVLAAADATQRAGLTPRVLLDVAASEDNVSMIQRPRAVMFATHGYFIEHATCPFTYELVDGDGGNDQ